MKPKQGKKVKKDRKEGSQKEHTHLLAQIVKGEEKKEEERVVECKYGLYCAHLRAMGKCALPHRKSHFHFLNIAAPPNCIEEEEKEEQPLSKRQKKERKIIEKTIQNQIDVATLDRKEIMAKKLNATVGNKELIAELNESEKIVIKMVGSASASDFFAVLNKAKDQGLDVFDIKKRAMVQLKKKNEPLFLEVIDKEYRIANRLIKADVQNKQLSLWELYKDINYNTVEQVRQCFDGWFDQDEGIPNDSGEKLYLEKFIPAIFETTPEKYESQVYLASFKKEQIAAQIKSNILFYNLMIQEKIQKKMPYTKFLHLDCQDLSFTSMSDFLSKDCLNTFSSKCKNAPEYPFGQMELNGQKFINWISTRYINKFLQSATDFKVIFFIDNISHLFTTRQIEQFEEQKLKEKRLLLKAIKTSISSVFIFINPAKTVQQALFQTFDLNKDEVPSISLD